MREKRPYAYQVWGQHYTPLDVFERFIWPEIKDVLWDYLWMDLFAGTGNLILPILRRIPEERREEFFREHIYLQEVDPLAFRELGRTLVEHLRIPGSLVAERLVLADSFREYPERPFRSPYPLFHITNPPYLYLGHIRRRKELSCHLDLFEGERKGLQDLYQVALWNDLARSVSRAIYIVPTNFLFGDAISRGIRELVFRRWHLEKAILLERSVFEKTGTHVGVFFFRRKEFPSDGEQTFPLFVSASRSSRFRTCTLSPQRSYRAGSLFWDFVERFRVPRPLSFKFYLLQEEVAANWGPHEVVLLDANGYERSGREYRRLRAKVNARLLKRLRSSPVYVKTVDTGREGGRAGLRFVHHLGVDGIVVTKAPYRTHPIQVFFEESLDLEALNLLVQYFNRVLDHFRQAEGGEFLTTYKYSKTAEHTRKYLGLKAVSAILETFPVSVLEDGKKRALLAQALGCDGIGPLLELLEQEKQGVAL